MSKKTKNAKHAAVETTVGTAVETTVGAAVGAAVKTKDAPISPWYLEYVRLTSFGAFTNHIVGPFTPGLNVVYGSNESGKTTINQLVKGVLFGWPAARGSVNTYRPQAAERAGSLYFTNCITHETSEVTRNNTTAPDEQSLFLSGIDKTTYNTMFALTSEELLSLNQQSNVTAHLLTAGSGTMISPAYALSELEGRIKTSMSKSAHAPQSIPHLREQEAALRSQLAMLTQKNDDLCRQIKHLENLQPQQRTLQNTLSKLDTEIDTLRTRLAQLESLEGRIDVANNHINQTQESLQAAQSAISVQTNLPESITDEELHDIQALVLETDTQLRALQEALDNLDDQRVRLAHSLANAQGDVRKSQAQYDAEREDDTTQTSGWRMKQRYIQVGGASIISFILILLGIFVGYQGIVRGSITYCAFGVLIIVGAIIVGAGATSVLLRPTKEEEAQEDRLKKIEWVLAQDKKTLAAAERDVANHNERIATYLDSNGFASVQGSLRRARVLLDYACNMRSYRAAQHHNVSLLTNQLKQHQQELADLQAEYSSLCRELRVDSSLAKEQVQATLNRKTNERIQTRTLVDETNREVGKITQELQQSRSDTTFEEVKLQHAQIKAQLEAAQHDLAVLLLARNTLREAISCWERKSQPEVYRIASRLLGDMTNGTWCQVRMNAQNNIEVVDAKHTTRAPELLSLGTRQQLYLSIRIALLITATNVGQALPIMCDDILVNFDDERRVGAVRALQELARYRQVIVYTCHPDVAALISTVDSQSNRVEL